MANVVENPERWHNIPGWEGKYMISHDAEVLNIKKSECTSRYFKSKEKTRISKKGNVGGYWSVSFYSDGKRHTKYVHRLMAEVFIPNPNNLPQVNHINGVKTDNRIENLEWCTAKENIRHAHRLGLRYGEQRLGSCTITDGIVNDIKMMKRNSAKNYEIAKVYKTDVTTISKILNNHIKPL